jgi:hypothetical protein
VLASTRPYHPEAVGIHRSRQVRGAAACKPEITAEGSAFGFEAVLSGKGALNPIEESKAMTERFLRRAILVFLALYAFWVVA